MFNFRLIAYLSAAAIAAVCIAYGRGRWQGSAAERRFWESLDNRSRSLLSNRPDVLKAIFDSVRVRERYRADTWERQWKRREWRRV